MAKAQEVETVKIVSEKGDYKVINKSDFDPRKGHKLFVEKKAEEKKADEKEGK